MFIQGSELKILLYLMRRKVYSCQKQYEQQRLPLPFTLLSTIYDYRSMNSIFYYYIIAISERDCIARVSTQLTSTSKLRLLRMLRRRATPSQLNFVLTQSMHLALKIQCSTIILLTLVECADGTNEFYWCNTSPHSLDIICGRLVVALTADYWTKRSLLTFYSIAFSNTTILFVRAS